MASKMKGWSPFTQKSALKQTYDASDTDTRVYDIDQNKYDAWRKKSNSDAPDIRYLGSKENKKYLEAYLKSKKGTTTEEVKKEVEEKTK